MDFSFMPMSHLGEDTQNLPQEGFSQMIERFYGERASEERRKSVSSALEKLMANQESRLQRKLANQRNDLLRAEKREDLKRRADLIMANIHMIPQGAEKVTVTDYFSPDLPQVELELDGDKTPQQNAQALFKEYTRLKAAISAPRRSTPKEKARRFSAERIHLAFGPAHPLRPEQPGKRSADPAHRREKRSVVPFPEGPWLPCDPFTQGQTPTGRIWSTPPGSPRDIQAGQAKPGPH